MDTTTLRRWKIKVGDGPVIEVNATSRAAAISEATKRIIGTVRVTSAEDTGIGIDTGSQTHDYELVTYAAKTPTVKKGAGVSGG